MQEYATIRETRLWETEDSIAATTVSTTKHILETWNKESHLTFLGKKQNSSHQRKAIKALLLIICHSTTK